MLRYLSVLVILACPLMMIFMMRGMGGGMSRRGTDAEGADQDMPSRSDRAGSDSADESQLRIADLEREVARLREQQSGSEQVPHSPEHDLGASGATATADLAPRATREGR